MKNSHEKKTCLPAGRAALYDPYLDTLGGGEKHILSILKVLEDEGYDINILWDNDLSEEIKNKLHIDFKSPNLFQKNIFRNKTVYSSSGANEYGRSREVTTNSSRRVSLARTINTLLTLHKFDYFFYVTDGSYFFSTAKHNFVFCMVPKKELYVMSCMNKLKTRNYKFISNSHFTCRWLDNWGIKSNVIYPYLDQELVDASIDNSKDKIILSVGRFFKHLHSKRQDIIIKLFKEVKKKNPLFKDFKLILAGGLKQEDIKYYKYLKTLIEGDRAIILKPNIEYLELVDIYRKSLIYWHFTGYGINGEEHPELTEHFGITPIEAMAYGCITFCFNAGGPKEIIKDSINGFLFNNNDELLEKTVKVISDYDLQKSIKNKGKEFIQENFNYEIFKNRVKEVILVNRHPELVSGSQDAETSSA